DGEVERWGELCKQRVVTGDIVEPVGISLDNHHIARASSTLIRTLLAEGRVRDAARVLGRPYELAGTVVRGERRGRTISYPTANIDTDQLLPADGVYAGWATISHQHDDSNAIQHTLRAAISIGTKPTFGDKPRTAEAFLLDAPNDPASPAIAGLPEYGFAIRLTFARHIRDQMRFDALDQLIAQMDRDITRTRALLPDNQPEPKQADHHAANA
ncbi:MAG: riboflavin kinase, partial [Planctomycetota bacterium]